MIWHVRDRTGATFTVREQVEPDDEPCPPDLCGACEDWFAEAHGTAAGHRDVQSLFYSLPEGADPDDKTVDVAQVSGRAS